MSFGMAERHHVRANDSKFDGSIQDKKADRPSDDKTGDELDPIIELDRKDLLIVKDGTVRVAESLDREQQQLDANGEIVKASGMWTKTEHERFLRAMETFPKGPWKAIADMVATRTVRQTQTHAQKYREKLARRMRGLRNRNGTLQTPPMSISMVPGLVSFPQQTLSPYANAQTRVYQHPHPGAMGYTSMMAQVSSASMAPATVALARTSSLPILHSSPFHLQHTPYVSSAKSTSVVMASPEFNQLSTSTIFSAFIGNATSPSEWEANAVEVKPTVPDFDESMDYLMDVYSINPTRINTAVSPTACIPRTPQTPTPSLAHKRHPGYGFVQQPQSKHAKHLAHAVNREHEAKDV